MLSRDEDGVCRDAVHKDAGGSFKVIQMYVAVFGDNVDHIVSGSNLGMGRKVCMGCKGGVGGV